MFFRNKKIYVKELDTKHIHFVIFDNNKRYFQVKNYFNLGFFHRKPDGYIMPVGHFVTCGTNLSDDSYQQFMPTYGKALSTLCIYNNYTTKISKIVNIDNIDGLRYAISGMPILKNGKAVSLSDIKYEGYSCKNLHNTWHGFLGLRHDGQLVYIAAKCEYKDMANILIKHNLVNAIKIDGGGSFIYKNEDGDIVATFGNRKIHNVCCFTDKAD